MTITELKKGDIFKWGNKSWDEEHRFHSIEQYPDGRYCIMLMGVRFAGNVEKAGWHAFTWRDTDVDIFIPIYYLCEFKKSRGIPCVPVNNHRQFLPTNLNAINMSDVYCNRNDYWYDYQDLI